MRITAVDAGAFGSERNRPLPAHRAPALVEPPVAASRPETIVSARRVLADPALVAHLWAARENVPQARARRRAASGEAGAAYAEAARLKRPEDAPARSLTA